MKQRALLSALTLAGMRVSKWYTLNFACLVSACLMGCVGPFQEAPTSSAPLTSSSADPRPQEPQYVLRGQTPKVFASAKDPVELGMKFRVSQNGTLVGIRFYRPADSATDFPINLYNSNGTRLATAKSNAGQSAPGWILINFASPVAIESNTTYVASYFAPNGQFAFEENGLANPISNGAITILGGSESGGNGIFHYGSGGFPNETYENSNYFVDVAFVPSGTLAPTPIPTTTPSPTPAPIQTPTPMPEASSDRIPKAVSGRDWYVSSSGADSSSCGTKTTPCRSINYVDNNKVGPGDVVHVTGSYSLTSNTCISTGRSGTASAPITYVADPIGSAKINGKAACFYMWKASGNYVRVYGFDFTGTQTNDNMDSGTSVFITTGGNNEFAYNTVHDLPYGFATSVNMTPYGSSGDYSGAPCSVHDNIFFNLAPGTGLAHGNYALYISCGTDSYIYNNLMYNIGSVGIHLWHAANNVKVFNNTVANSAIGITVGTGDGGAVSNAYYEVFNNIVVNSEYGIHAAGSVSRKSVFKNNLIHKNQIDWYYGGGSLQDAGFSVTGTINADPRFVSPNTGNFRLSPGSPAIDKGISAGAPTVDLDNHKRPVGSGIDLGAFEAH